MTILMFTGFFESVPDEMLEQQMIRYCAPVLAGMKIANLSRYQAETETQLEKETPSGPFY